MELTSLQRRMLKETTFHFDSGRGNAHNYDAAWELERAGFLHIKVNQYSQHAVYQCTVTDAGTKALAAMRAVATGG